MSKCLSMYLRHAWGADGRCQRCHNHRNHRATNPAYYPKSVRRAMFHASRTPATPPTSDPPPTVDVPAEVGV